MRAIVLAALLVFVSASVALGDGCYLPRVAVRKIPAIPAQRALLTWKDGIETLIISSALDSEAQELGWIIPLPSVPTTIEKATPGGLRTLALVLQPEITHDLSEQLETVLIIALVANVLLGTLLFKRKLFLRVLLLVFFAFLFHSLLLPAGAPLKGIATAAKVMVEKTAIVGSYDVNVLRPTSFDDLNKWLSQAGYLELPSTANAIVSGYLKTGWVFAAIKLTRAETGANAPHPIKLVFPSKEAVYPLKLTSLAGGQTHFDLFVVGAQQAACSQLQAELCDKFVVHSLQPDHEERYETFSRAEGQIANVAHPGVAPLLWDGCVLTRFTGVIEAGRMKEDIDFKWTAFKAHRQHVYTVQGATQSAIILFTSLAAGFLFLSMVCCVNRTVSRKSAAMYLIKIFLPATVLFAVVTYIRLSDVPKLNDGEVATSRAYRQWHSVPVLESKLASLLPKLQNDRRTEAEIAEELLAAVSDTKNLLAGTEIRLEDSPGNFTVQREGGKVVIRAYDRDGRAILVRAAAPEPEDTPVTK